MSIDLRKRSSCGGSEALQMVVRENGTRARRSVRDTTTAGDGMGSWRGVEVGGRRVVLAGADGSTLGTLTALLHAGARLRVIASKSTPAVKDLADRNRLELITDRFEPRLLDGAGLAIAGFGDAAADAQVLAAAESANVPAIQLRPIDRPTRRQRTGEVILVGGGPGDPGLITVAGLE